MRSLRRYSTFLQPRHHGRKVDMLTPIPITAQMTDDETIEDILFVKPDLDTLATNVQQGLDLSLPLVVGHDMKGIRQAEKLNVLQRVGNQSEDHPGAAVYGVVTSDSICNSVEMVALINQLPYEGVICAPCVGGESQAHIHEVFFSLNAILSLCKKKIFLDLKDYESVLRQHPNFLGELLGGKDMDRIGLIYPHQYNYHLSIDPHPAVITSNVHTLYNDLAYLPNLTAFYSPLHTIFPNEMKLIVETWLSEAHSNSVTIHTAAVLTQILKPLENTMHTSGLGLLHFLVDSIDNCPFKGGLPLPPHIPVSKEDAPSIQSLLEKTITDMNQLGQDIQAWSAQQQQ